MKGLVSIIIPAYNAAPFIAHTINSVKAQTYTDWELIIVNDGSVDATEEAIKAFLTDKRIRYYYQPNAGVSAARNSGLEKAKGEYITFFDADDAMEPANLEKKVKLLEEEPGIGWVFSDMYQADEKMNRLGIAPEGTDIEIEKKILLWESEVIPGPCSNVVCRKKCLEGLRFDIELSTAADQDFSLMLARKCKGKRIPEPLWTYRLSAQSMSRNVSTMERDHILVYRKAQRNGLFPTPAFRQKCFSNLYLTLAGSWWVDGKNKKRGLYFILRSVLAYPPVIGKLLKKLLR